MPGTMSRADLRAELKDSLHDAASVLADPADFDRCLAVAAEDLGRLMPRTLASTLTLVAGQAEYAAPADFLRFKMALWGASTPVQPWDKCYPGRLPDVSDAAGLLVLSPAPTAMQIALLGASYRFFYFAGYAVADAAAQTTVPEHSRSLLLLRAQAEACRELALRNVSKPVTMRDAVGSQPRNGTPSALYQMLLAEFETRVGR